MDFSGYKDDYDILDASDRAAAQLLTFFAASRAVAPSKGCGEEGESFSERSEIGGSVMGPKVEGNLSERIRFEVAKGSSEGSLANEEIVSETVDGEIENTTSDSSSQATLKGKTKQGGVKQSRDDELFFDDENPKPKRPMSAYNYFFQAERAKLSGNVEETSKVIGQRWKDLKTDKRRCFVALAEQDSRRYREELREYQFRGAAGPRRMSVDLSEESNQKSQSIPSLEAAPDQKLDQGGDQVVGEKTLKRSVEVPAAIEPRPSKKPKKPLTAFNLFYKEEKPRFQGSRMNKVQVTEVIGQKWLELDPLLRQKYEAFAESDAHRYELEFTAYEKYKAVAKASRTTGGGNDVGKNDSLREVLDVKEQPVVEQPREGEPNEPKKEQLVAEPKEQPKKLEQKKKQSRKMEPKKEPLESAEPRKEQSSKMSGAQKEQAAKGGAKKEQAKKSTKKDIAKRDLPKKNQAKVSSGEKAGITALPKNVDSPAPSEKNTKIEIAHERHLMDSLRAQGWKMATEETSNRPTVSSPVLDMRTQMGKSMSSQISHAPPSLAVAQAAMQGGLNRAIPQHAAGAHLGNGMGNHSMHQAARLASARQEAYRQASAQNEAEALARLMAGNPRMNHHPASGQDIQQMLQLRALQQMQSLQNGRMSAHASAPSQFNHLMRSGGLPGGYQGHQNMSPNAMASMQQMLSANSLSGHQQQFGARGGDASIQALLPLLLSKSPADIHPSHLAALSREMGLSASNASNLEMNQLLAMSQLLPGNGSGGAGLSQGGAGGSGGSQNPPDVAALLAMLGNIANGY